MAKGQGAAGVRITLRDMSEIQIVNEPLITAGVVGFSSKGPLNKIINLSSTETMDSVIGSGYNNPKFNQGLYAARGILNARSNVEFVRPYGESIVTDNTDVDAYQRNQQLKSDAFVVNYDFGASATDSIEINHYAATRWYLDKMATDYPGSSRQIYRISDAIVENTNIKFALNTDAVGDSVPLFAIINEDPTSANRAEDDAIDVTTTGDDYLLVRTAASNTAGKCVENIVISGAPAIADQFDVTRMDGSKVTIEFIDPTGVISQSNPNAYPVPVTVQTFVPADVTTGATIKITLSDISGYSVGDRITFAGAGLPTSDDDDIVAGTIYSVSAISGNDITIATDAAVPVNLVFTTTPNSGSGTNSIYNLTNQLELIGDAFTAISFGIEVQVKSTEPKMLSVTTVRGVRIPDSITSFYDFTSLTTAYLAPQAALDEIETTVGVLIESSIGRRFVSLGLAIESYVDIDFDGVLDKVYTLTSDGVNLAALYIEVDYYFGGVLYNFSGTIVPFVLNDENMFIGESALSVENGFKFIVNEHPALGEAAASSSFNLSATVSDSLTSSKFEKTAYDDTDPAVINDVIWIYDPRNNNTTQILSSAWNLFLKKDQTNTDMFISAGTAIKNLFVRGSEQINYDVMNTILTICEQRKDCYAIFDGVDESRIDKALSAMVGIGSQGGDIGRWGAIFDGRSYMADNIYTKLTVEVVKSIEVSQIIAFNRASNVYWLAPAGYQSGRIPSSMASRQKYIRSYGYGAADYNSDIAKLYDSNINPTRVTQAGAFIFGQRTMLRRNTALNRLNVIMLIAGIHRRFANYLDEKTFQLNTAQLRNNIQSELQARIDAIRTANPAGITAGIVTCDESNNTPDVIDRNELIVDVKIQPTRTAEFITLRTTVQRTGSDFNADTSIIGG